jgi:hypothetical protein
MPRDGLTCSVFELLIKGSNTTQRQLPLSLELHVHHPHLYSPVQFFQLFIDGSTHTITNCFTLLNLITSSPLLLNVPPGLARLLRLRLLLLFLLLFFLLPPAPCSFLLRTLPAAVPTAPSAAAAAPAAMTAVAAAAAPPSAPAAALRRAGAASAPAAASAAAAAPAGTAACPAAWALLSAAGAHCIVLLLLQLLELCCFPLQPLLQRLLLTCRPAVTTGCMCAEKSTKNVRTQ